MPRYNSTAQMAWAAIQGSLAMEEVLDSFEFRTVKGHVCTVEDMHKAIAKGMQKGQGKLEYEIQQVGVELAKVLKPKKG